MPMYLPRINIFVMRKGKVTQNTVNNNIDLVAEIKEFDWDQNRSASRKVFSTIVICSKTL